jgi:outer membrane immunogenic protein
MEMRFKLAALLLASSAVIIAQSSVAADLPARPIYKSPAEIVAWNWTGAYVGAYVGVGVSKSRGHDPDGNPAGDLEHTGYGFTGGGTLGYNYQLNWGLFGQKFVIGAEGDIGYFDTSHKVIDWNDNLFYDAKTSWLATARARVGLTDGPNFNYVTGGFAAARIKDINTDTVSLREVSSSKIETGWVIGSGVETMLGGGWSAKSESLYINLGSGDTVTNLAAVFPASIQTDRREYYTQRFGVNYLFGAGKNGPLPQVNWNGLYVGGVFGGAVGSVRGTGNDFNPFPPNSGEIGNHGSGFTAGGQIGWNWMIAPKWVVGVEGDISYLGIDHMSTDYFNAVGSGNQSLLIVDTSWIATARGRIAYNTGPALLYATGGGAWVHVRDTFIGNFGGLPSSTKTLSGWTVGGGIETVLWGNWSSKTEYLYVDVGEGDTLRDLPGSFSITADHKFHLFRSGLVYRFNGNPFGAKL